MKSTDTENMRVARKFKEQLEAEAARQRRLNEDARVTLVGITEQLTIIPETNQARYKREKQ